MSLTQGIEILMTAVAIGGILGFVFGALLAHRVE